VHQAGVRRVTIYADTHYVDLMLSAAVPIGSLIPPIVDILALELGDYAERYQLSAPGDIALDPSMTLEQAQIRDGAVLLLSSSSTVLTAPRFDDAADAVSAALDSRVSPWTRQATRLIGALVAGWLTATAAAILIGMAFGSNDVRRGDCAGVAAVSGLVALLAAMTAHRVFGDRSTGLAVGLAASGLAAVAGMLAVPGKPGAPHALLATAAAATSATIMRVIGSSATIFTALASFAMVQAAAALVGALTAVPLAALGAASATISLLLVEAAAPLAIVLARLTSDVSLEPDASGKELSAKAIRGRSWLTSLLAAFSASAAVGAIGAAAGSLFTGGPRWLGVAFATITGGVLLLRARSHPDRTRSVPLVAAGIVTLSATLVITAAADPRYTPYLAALSTILAAAALWIAFVACTTRPSPIRQRSVELLEYLALAVVVPLACWICGLYGAVRGMNL
jgi:type VII secretion integral membrane protein EccD